MYQFRDVARTRREAMSILGEAVRTVLLMLAPFAPHIADELWHELGYKRSIHEETWPAVDEKRLS